MTDERNPQGPTGEPKNIYQSLYDSGQDVELMHIEALRAEVRKLRHTASQLAGAVPQEELRALLYRCIKELDYVQSVEHISQCASAEGKELIELGMKLLGVQDLSLESLVEKRSGA